MKALWFIAFSILLANWAQAAEDLYPCNLELRRPVTSASTSGAFYARVYVEDKAEAAGSSLKYKWMTLTAPKTGEWVSLFSATQEFQYNIVTLQFPQSLEDLGVSYRVGFCYAGPVSTSGPKNSPDSSMGQYDLVGTLNVGSSANLIPYSAVIYGKCDLRVVGKNKQARASQEIFPGVIESDMSFTIPMGLLSSGEMGFEYSINSQNNQVPRFCKLLVEVKEEATGSRPSEVNLNQAQFTFQIDKNLR